MANLAMFTALKILGYKSYHSASIRLRPPGTYSWWNEAIKAKYHGEGEKYGKVEFDKLLGEYNVCKKALVLQEAPFS